MRSKLTAKSLSFDVNVGGASDNGSGRRNNARRHARILDADPNTLIALNVPVQTCTAPNVTAIEAAVSIARLEQILSRPRRGPLRAGLKPTGFSR